MHEYSYNVLNNIYHILSMHKRLNLLKKYCIIFQNQNLTYDALLQTCRDSPFGYPLLLLILLIFVNFLQNHFHRFFIILLVVYGFFFIVKALDYLTLTFLVFVNFRLVFAFLIGALFHSFFLVTFYNYLFLLFCFYFVII